MKARKEQRHVRREDTQGTTALKEQRRVMRVMHEGAKARKAQKRKDVRDT